MVFHPKSPIKGQHARILSELKNWGSAPWAACRVTFRPIRAIFETDGRVFTSFWFSGSQFDGALNLCYRFRQLCCAARLKRSGGRAHAGGFARCLFTEKFEWNLFYCDLIIQSESNPLVNPIIWR